MKQLVTFSALALSLALGSAHAAEEKAPTKQQTKMATCNADAKTKDLKGDERKAFMKECLSNKPATQQGRWRRSRNVNESRFAARAPTCSPRPPP